MDVLFYQKTDSDPAVKIVEFLAREIWPEYYTPIIGSAQVDYMLDHFQSAAAIQEQIKGGHVYYLIMYGRIPTGYLSVLPEPEKGALFLGKLYISSLYRGQGFGVQTLNFVEKTARGAGLSKITLQVCKKNASAISFYEHCGFRIAGPVFKDIGGGFAMDDLILEKNVKH